MIVLPVPNFIRKLVAKMTISGRRKCESSGADVRDSNDSVQHLVGEGILRAEEVRMDMERINALLNQAPRSLVLTRQNAIDDGRLKRKSSGGQSLRTTSLHRLHSMPAGPAAPTHRCTRPLSLGDIDNIANTPQAARTTSMPAIARPADPASARSQPAAPISQRGGKLTRAAGSNDARSNVATKPERAKEAPSAANASRLPHYSSCIQVN